MATFTPKNKNGLFLIFFAQTRLIWNNLSSTTENSHIGHFSHTVFITELEFLIKNDFQSKMLDLKIHLDIDQASKWWIFKSNIFDWKSFLIKNSNSVMKTEWEKCPIWLFLLIELKLFQIRRVCAKKIKNNPFLFFGIKVAINQQ